MKKIPFLAIATLLICTSCGTMANSHVANQNVINEYLEQLAQDISSGGSLYCETDSKEIAYDNCTSFVELRKQGCYGYSTVEMGRENHYSLLCQESEILKNAKIAETSFFDLEADDWWESIPAEVIPMRGGIYTEEQWEQHWFEHQELVNGRSLGELDFFEVTTNLEGLEAYLSSKELDCGRVVDFFNMNIILLADLDDDGIAELLVRGYRTNQSETCYLGSGNFLGAEYMAIVNKDNNLEIPSVTPIPKTD